MGDFHLENHSDVLRGTHAPPGPGLTNLQLTHFTPPCRWHMARATAKE